MSVWISDEKLLIFASLISPSKKILFEKKYCNQYIDLARAKSEAPINKFLI